MKRKHYFLRGLFFSTFIIVNLFLIQSSFPQGAPKPPQEHTTQVTYSLKSQSLTKDFEIVIDNNGLVNVVNKDYYFHEDYYDDFEYTVNYSKPKPKVILKSGKLSEKELKEFKQTILDANVFQFKDEYIGSPNHLGYRGEIVTFTIDDKTKRILISASGFPVELGRLIYKIGEIKEKINEQSETFPITSTAHPEEQSDEGSH